MRKLLLASTLIGSMFAVSAASAADLPRRQTPPPVFEQAFTWTGFYIGVNAGYGFGGDSKSIYENTYWGHTSRSSDAGGFIGGGQIGYNYQVNEWVYGIEADIQYTDLGGEISYDRYSGNWYSNSSHMGGDLNYFGTLRARIGYAGFDRTLFYVTGGLAYGGGDDDGFCQYLINNYTNTYGKCMKDNAWGWTIGAGVEYAFTDNLTAKFEGLYVDIDRKKSHVDYTTATGTYNAYRTTGTDGFGIVRIGLNYKF